MVEMMGGGGGGGECGCICICGCCCGFGSAKLPMDFLLLKGGINDNDKNVGNCGGCCGLAGFDGGCDVGGVGDSCA